MTYPGGMSQLAHDQQENESGLDLCEAWHHEQEQNLAVAKPVQPDSCKQIASLIDAYKQPF